MSNAVLSGGSGLNGALKAIAERLSNARAVNVGFQDGSTDDKGMSNATKAFLNEYGTAKTPSRPFFRNMIAKEKGAWAGDIKQALKSSNYDGNIALGAVGDVIAGQLRKSINDLTSPPLAMSTVLARANRYADKRRGSVKNVSIAKPLIDTHSMIDSITSEVV